MTIARLVYKNARRELSKRVSRPDGSPGFTTVDDGCEIADIELTVNMPALAAYLANDAMTNKAATSKLASGLIVAKVVRRERIKP